MKNFIFGVFDQLLSDPLNQHICNIGLIISSIVFFGNIIVQLIIRNL